MDTREIEETRREQWRSEAIPLGEGGGGSLGGVDGLVTCQLFIKWLVMATGSKLTHSFISFIRY
jgi:hypothetical protein